MEEELIDRFQNHPKGKGNQTITFFLVSLGLISVVIIIAILGNFIRMPAPIFVFSFLCGVTAFALSLAGIITGTSERKYSTNWVRTGLIGNSIIVSCPILFIIILIVDYITYLSHW